MYAVFHIDRQFIAINSPERGDRMSPLAAYRFTMQEWTWSYYRHSNIHKGQRAAVSESTRAIIVFLMWDPESGDEKIF